jgi:imidazolonepropionase-like amidohydrolase
MQEERRTTAAGRILWMIPAVILLIVAAGFATAQKDARKGQEKSLVLLGAKVYTSPDDPPIDGGAVLITGNKIAAVGKASDVPVPPNAERINCKGKVITAGFQNSHVHFDEPDKWTDAANIPATTLSQRLANMLTRYGFTTVVDTGSLLLNTVAIRRRIESGEVAGPRILTAGGPLYPKDGIPYYLKNSLPPDIVKILAQPETPAAAVRVVDANLDGGADIIKLFTGSWVERGKVKPMSVNIAAAATAEAHHRGHLVFTHPSNVAGLEVALRAHVDVLAHAIESLDGWDSSYIAKMREGNMALIPTLKLFGGNSNIQAILDEVVTYQRAGGQILFGTDVGYMTEYDPMREYELMERAGLTPMQILASLTTAPAERFGEGKQRGRIVPGMDADLVVLDADPVEDPANFAKVCQTYRAGKQIFAKVGGSLLNVTVGGCAP